MKVMDHIWLWLILLFVGYIGIAGSPEMRIVRICEPVNWGGRMLESITLLISSDRANGVRAGAQKMEKGCQITIYRQMYPEAYDAMLKAATEKLKAETKDANK